MMTDDDFKLLKGFALGQTNRQIFAIVESLSCLKILKLSMNIWKMRYVTVTEIALS